MLHCVSCIFSATKRQHLVTDEPGGTQGAGSKDTSETQSQWT